MRLSSSINSSNGLYSKLELRHKEDLYLCLSLLLETRS